MPGGAADGSGSAQAPAMTAGPRSSSAGGRLPRPERFAPGTTLAGRYRITALLGRGGMGEVYRADDLVLDQPVALKFLPDAIALDPDRIERFRAEVRVARQVSHPSVCRVYDIGEIDGRPFLSMEYIDGEDLTSLLRRIGRLPHDTAVDMARQLCAGLAAAHDKGVLHRDLKPANVMIDGRGKVRLADFGLAALAGDPSGEGLAGTPAYMAPELFDHQSPSIKSDIYALGLVLYEMFTGKAAFTAPTVGEIARLHHESMPASLSRVLTEADPLVDRVIERCLAKDPADRPASALAVAAALPGGDPIAAALAAGETPSPEMVAASGGVGALTPAVGALLLAVSLVSVFVVVLLSARTQAVRYAPLTRGPEVLADQAQSILRRIGYTDPPADRAYGYTSTDYVRYLERHDQSPTRWNGLRIGQPPGFTFWYRESPVQLTTDRLSSGGRVRLYEPPLNAPGMIGMMLDAQGRLHYLDVVPPIMADVAPSPAGADGTDIAPSPAGADVADVGPSPAGADWAAVFREAGMDIASFTPAAPRWTPPAFADTRRAWQGVYPDRPEVPIRVEAAAVAGKPVYFQIFEPWSQTTLLPRAVTTGEQVLNVLVVALALGLFAGALLLVRRNLRLGRGDQAGAFRLSFVLLILNVAADLLAAEHSAQPFQVAGLLALVLGRALTVSALVWITYVALEPDLRRRAPHLLISWTRLLSGRFSDPLVGRDVLVGAAAAAAGQVLTQLAHLAPAWVGRAPGIDVSGGPAVSAWSLVSEMLATAGFAVLIATSFVLLVLLLLVLLRSRVLTAVVFAAIVMTLEIADSGFGLGLAFDLLAAGIAAVVVLRFGLVAFVAMNYVRPLLDRVPLTFDPDLWYAGQSWLVLAVVAGIALYGYRTAVAGRSTFAWE